MPSVGESQHSSIHAFHNMSYLKDHFVDQTGKNFLDPGDHVATEADLAPRVEGDGRVVGGDELGPGRVDSFDGDHVDRAVAVLLEPVNHKKTNVNWHCSF